MGMVGAILIVCSWWINALYAPPGWACDERTTGFDMWSIRSTSLDEVLATVAPPEGAVMRDPERGSAHYAVRQYLLDGEIVQEVKAMRGRGQWAIDSISSC